MKNCNLAIKLTFFAFFALAIGACFSPWQGDEGTLTLSFGDSARYIFNNDIQNYSYQVKLEGPGGTIDEKIDSGSITFKLLPGTWNITVKAKNEGELRAFGTKKVEVKAGKNLTETIDMYGATEVSTFEELSLAVNSVADAINTEEIIIITGDITADKAEGNLVTIWEDTKIFLCAEKDFTLKYINFTVESGGFLALGREGMKGNITIDGGYDSTDDSFGELSLITVQTDGVFKMHNGTIRNNKTSYGGGVKNMGTFAMYGGTISDNIALYDGGGGIYNEGNFIMEGGSIVNNTASDQEGYDEIVPGKGGGIYNYEGGILELNGGKITGNTASLGSGVYSWTKFEYTTDISGNIGSKDICIQEKISDDPIEPEQYIIFLKKDTLTGGTFTVNNSNDDKVLASYFDIITVIAYPSSGNKVKEVNVNYEDGRSYMTSKRVTDSSVYSYTFEMPSSNVIVSVDFEVDEIIPITYTITINQPLDGGEIKVSQAEASEGMTITITAFPDQNYTIKDVWTDPSQNLANVGSEYTFIMPAANVTVSASFMPVHQDDITVIVTATGNMNTVIAGESLQFNAEVTNSSLGVTWKITNGNSPNTIITPEGFLVVNSEETAKEINVIATSVEDGTKLDMKKITVIRNFKIIIETQGPSVPFNIIQTVGETANREKGTEGITYYIWFESPNDINRVNRIEFTVDDVDIDKPVVEKTDGNLFYTFTMPPCDVTVIVWFN